MPPPTEIETVPLKLTEFDWGVRVSVDAADTADGELGDELDAQPTKPPEVMTSEAAINKRTTEDEVFLFIPNITPNITNTPSELKIIFFRSRLQF